MSVAARGLAVKIEKVDVPTGRNTSPFHKKVDGVVIDFSYGNSTTVIALTLEQVAELHEKLGRIDLGDGKQEVKHGRD